MEVQKAGKIIQNKKDTSFSSKPCLTTNRQYHIYFHDISIRFQLWLILDPKLSYETAAENSLLYPTRIPMMFLFLVDFTLW